MDYVLVDVLQTVVAHASNQEPGAYVWILLDSERILPLGSSINVQSSEVAGKLTTILGDQAPLGELFLFWSLHVESTNLIATKLKPEHVVCQVEEQMVLFRAKVQYI